MTAERLAALFGLVRVPLPLAACRALLRTPYLYGQRSVDTAWVARAHRSPSLATGKAQTELGWSPAHDTEDTITEFARASALGAGEDSTPLRPLGESA